MVPCIVLSPSDMLDDQCLLMKQLTYGGTIRQWWPTNTNMFYKKSCGNILTSMGIWHQKKNASCYNFYIRFDSRENVAYISPQFYARVCIANTSQYVCTRLMFWCVLLRLGIPRFYPYPSGSLHWHWGNHVVAPAQVKQPWRIWVNKLHKSLGAYNITTTQEIRTHPSAHLRNALYIINVYMEYWQSLGICVIYHS